jgi:hypothetical protein
MKGWSIQSKTETNVHNGLQCTNMTACGSTRFPKRRRERDKALYKAARPLKYVHFSASVQ